MFYGLFIIGAYFCSALVVRLLYNRMHAHDIGSKHYVIYTLDNQLHIEWIIQSLLLFYWIQGISISITIIDEGSSDDTLAILRLLSRQHQLDVRPMDDDHLQPLLLRDTSIHIRLNRPEDRLKLPQVSSLW